MTEGNNIAELGEANRKHKHFLEMTKKIAIIGLGYVGLPLAVEFAKKFSVIGFDINQSRVDELNKGHDPTLEVEDKDLKAVLTSKQSLFNNRGK